MGGAEESPTKNLFFTKNAMEVFKFIEIDEEIKKMGHGINQIVLQLGAESKLNQSTEKGVTLGTAELLEGIKKKGQMGVDAPHDYVISSLNLHTILSKQIALLKIPRISTASVRKVEKEGKENDTVNVSFKGSFKSNDDFNLVVGTDYNCELVDTSNKSVYEYYKRNKLIQFRATIPKSPDVNSKMIVENWFYSKKKVVLMPLSDNSVEISYYLNPDSEDRVKSTHFYTRPLSKMANIITSSPFKYGIYSSIRLLKDEVENPKNENCHVELISSYRLKNQFRFNTKNNTILIANSSANYPSYFGVKESSDIEDAYWLCHAISTLSPSLAMAQFTRNAIIREQKIDKFVNKITKWSIFESNFPVWSRILRNAVFAPTPFSNSLRGLSAGFKDISSTSAPK